jgi:hypothetical protein
VKWLIGLPPEAQATLAVGVIAILVQPIFIVITFLLGKSQGRAQTRHERASDALVEAMRMMSDVQIDLFMWSSMRKHDHMEREYRKKIVDSRQRLRDLVYNNAVWFDPKTESKLKAALQELNYRCEEHSNGIDKGDDDYATHTGERLNEWATTPFIQTQLDLRNEARRLIGSKRSWSLTWWGRPLAFFTRNTRFFPIVEWLRQHFAWLIAVPGAALIAALVTLLLIRRLLAP